MFYQTRDEVHNYEKPRTALPDSVAKRMISELRKKKKKCGKERNDDIPFELMVDAGCGYGRHSKIFVPYFRKIIGIDYSAIQIKRANEMNQYDNVEYFYGKAENLPVANESVDFVTFIFSAFFMDLKKVENELVRVLKPNGVAVIYGDLVEQLELLDEKVNPSSIQGSSKSPMDLWNACMMPFVEFANRTSHPERKLFDGNAAMFKEITLLRKRNVEDTRFQIEKKLDNFVEYFSSVPFYGDFANSQKTNPFDDLCTKLKDLWGIPHKNNSEVTISVTHRCFMLFLDQQNDQRNFCN